MLVDDDDVFNYKVARAAKLYKAGHSFTELSHITCIPKGTLISCLIP